MTAAAGRKTSGRKTSGLAGMGLTGNGPELGPVHGGCDGGEFNAGRTLGLMVKKRQPVRVSLVAFLGKGWAWGGREEFAGWGNG